jgi:hypothetical protein
MEMFKTCVCFKKEEEPDMTINHPYCSSLISKFVSQHTLGMTDDTIAGCIFSTCQKE